MRSVPLPHDAGAAPATSASPWEPPSPIRVLHVMATTTGGVGQVVLNLCTPPAHGAFESAAAFGRGFFLDAAFDEGGIETYRLGTTRRRDPLSIVRGYLALNRILAQHPFDIVHGHTAVGGLLARVVGKRRGKIVVFTVHNWALNGVRSRWATACVRRLERGLAMRTDAHVAVSAAKIAEGVANGVLASPAAAVLIRNGIDVQAFAAQSTGKAFLDELGLDRQGPVIGTVTRLEHQKGIDLLLRATALLVPTFPGLSVLIAGDGPLRGKLVKLSRRLGLAQCVRFLGWRRDPARVMGALDVFCLSSRWEGLPVCVLEAMAVGVPVVATDAGGTAEAVLDGETGLIVPCDDAAGLAEKTAALLGAPARRAEMGRAGRRRVEEHFTAVQMREGYEHLYRQLVRSCTYSNTRAHLTSAGIFGREGLGLPHDSDGESVDDDGDENG